MRPVRPFVNFFFYDARISRPLLFDQDLVVNFATYMRVYTVDVYSHETCSVVGVDARLTCDNRLVGTVM